MPELELTRSPEDRRLYAIEGVGTLRMEGLWFGRATAVAGADGWQLGGIGFLKRVVHATDAFGTVVGVFNPASMRRGGTLTWADREFALRPASRWRERYALADGDHELAVLDGKSWGKRPVKLIVHRPDQVAPGLLLMAAFVVRKLADDAASSSA